MDPTVTETMLFYSDFHETIPERRWFNCMFISEYVAYGAVELYHNVLRGLSVIEPIL